MFGKKNVTKLWQCNRIEIGFEESRHHFLILYQLTHHEKRPVSVL